MQHLDAIQAEYLKLQDNFEMFDDRALTIKAWSVTLCACWDRAAYVNGQPALLLISSVAALVFWTIDAYWKTNQQAFGQRMWEIEHAMDKGATVGLKPFQIVMSWRAERNKSREAWSPWLPTKRDYDNTTRKRIVLWADVALPHAAVVVVAAVLFGVYSLWWELA